MQITGLTAAKAALEGSLSHVEAERAAIADKADLIHAHVAKLEELKQNLTTELQSAQACQEQASQECTIARQRAAGLAAELEVKDCRLRSVPHAAPMCSDGTCLLIWPVALLPDLAGAAIFCDAFCLVQSGCMLGAPSHCRTLVTAFSKKAGHCELMFRVGSCRELRAAIAEAKEGHGKDLQSLQQQLAEQSSASAQHEHAEVRLMQHSDAILRANGRIFSHALILQSHIAHESFPGILQGYSCHCNLLQCGLSANFACLNSAIKSALLLGGILAHLKAPVRSI